MNKINYFSPDFVDHQFTLNPNHCRDEWAINRNKKLFEFIKDIKFNNVFDFAGGSGLLTEMFLVAHPEVKSYIHSDYSPVACKLAQDHLKNFKNVTVKTYDMTKDLDNISWKNFDLIMCTSMEHFPKGVDIEILNHVQKGTSILWGLSTFPAITHQHIYPNIEYVVVQFKDIIDIEAVSYSVNKRQVLLYGKKK